MSDPDIPPDWAVASGKLPLGSFVLDFGSEALRDGGGKPVELRPQAWAVLRHLAVNAGRLITKDELLAAVWPGLVVTDGSLTQAVCDIRGVLGDAGHRLIKTMPRRGYLLVADALAPPAYSGDAGRSRGASGRGADDPPTPLEPGVAVLAFRDPSGDADGQLLARGMAQELVAELARNRGLRVISHHSSFAFAEGETPLAEIGRRLRARHLVDGSVCREGDSLRIGVELLDSESGEVLWSSRYTTGSADLMAQRDTLVGRIAGTVLTRMTHRRDRSALALQPHTLDVYAMTLRAIALRRLVHGDATREARALLEQALVIDPGYAPAWSALGYVNGVDIQLRLTGTWHRDRLPLALAQVRRAIELGSEEPEAYIALALVQRVLRAYDHALEAAQRAVELGPGDSHCWYHLAECQLRCGEVEAAAASCDYSLELTPLPSGLTLWPVAGSRWAAGRLDDAVRAAGESIDKVPNLWIARFYRMLALAESGRIEAARLDAAALALRLPELDANFLCMMFSERAVSLRARVWRAALATGLSSGAAGAPLTPAEAGH